jgi:hypothetical protein
MYIIESLSNLSDVYNVATFVFKLYVENTLRNESVVTNLTINLIFHIFIIYFAR